LVSEASEAVASITDSLDDSVTCAVEAMIRTVGEVDIEEEAVLVQVAQGREVSLVV
jgi:hypothetical protein